MLVGKGITLRRIEKSDLWNLWKWHEENELYIFNRIDPSISIDLLNERFADFFNLNANFIIESGDGKSLGVCSLTNIAWKNRCCEVVFDVRENGTDQGVPLDTLNTLLTFVFEEYNLLRVLAYVSEYPTNQASIFEKIGFRLEGKLREHVFKDGRYRDVMVFALSRDDFPSSCDPQVMPT